MRRRDDVDFGEQADGVLDTRDVAVTTARNISQNLIHLLQFFNNFLPEVEQTVDCLPWPHSRPVEHELCDLTIRITDPRRRRGAFLLSFG